MDSESKAFRWVVNLRDQFNALCSEADLILPQEPIVFVRNQFLAVGESLKQFCAELLEDSLACLEEKNLDLLSRPKENGDCVGLVEVEVEEASEPPSKTKTTEGVLSDALVCSLVVESPVQIGKLAEEHLAPKACKISEDQVTSGSFVSISGFSEGEGAEDSNVSEQSGGIWFPRNPNGWQKLEGSDDEFCSDFDVEKVNRHLRRTASFKEWDEDLCESDWEII